MDIFDSVFKESEIDMMVIESEMISTYEETMINILEAKDDIVVVHEATSSFAAKVVNFINEIITYIKNAIVAVYAKFSNILLRKDAKGVLDNMEASLTPETASQKVTMYSDEKSKKALDKYVREMSKLERRLLDLKVYGKIGTKKAVANAPSIIIETNVIMKEMDRLNAEYDQEFLDENSEIITMSLKDAIRFNKKSLDSIRVDFDSYEKGSSKVLKEYKTDAEGCEDPVVLNTIQRLANSVGTRFRKYLVKHTKYRSSNMRNVLLCVGMIGAGVIAYHTANAGKKNLIDVVVKTPSTFINNLSMELTRDLEGMTQQVI